MGLEKVQKQDMDENTKKTTLPQKNYGKARLEDNFTSIEQMYCSSLSLPQLFCTRLVFLCFHSCLLLYLLQAHTYSYLSLIITENFYP